MQQHKSQQFKYRKIQNNKNANMKTQKYKHAQTYVGCTPKRLGTGGDPEEVGTGGLSNRKRKSPLLFLLLADINGSSQETGSDRPTVCPTARPGARPPLSFFLSFGHR